MITIMRSDDRLIHGQVQTQIIPHNNIQHIIIVDDTNASNPMLKGLLEMAAPKGTVCKLYTLKDAAAPINSAIHDDVKTLILTRKASVFADLFDQIPDMPKELNVASSPMVGGKKQTKITDFCYLDEKDMDAVKKMGNEGVHIYFQLFPTKQATEWDSVKGEY